MSEKIDFDFDYNQSLIIKEIEAGFDEECYVVTILTLN